MTFRIIPIITCMTLLASCDKPGKGEDKLAPAPVSTDIKGAYAEVNGIKLYYEIHGDGEPLVLLHGGGSTIQTTFGRVLPQLAKSHKVIAIELQNHGHSGFRDVPQTFEQDAADVAALLPMIGITKASFFGFSNGGTTSLVLAMTHPELVDKLIVASCAYKRSGLMPGFFDMMKHVTLENMPQPLKDAFLEINPDTTMLRKMFDRDSQRMINFKDWSDDQIRSIKAPTLIVNGDADVVTTEHVVEMSRLIQGAKLAILPGTHGEFMEEIMTVSDTNKSAEYFVPLIETFLRK